MNSTSMFYDIATLAEASYVRYDELENCSKDNILAALTNTPLDPNIPIDYKGKLSTS